VRGFRAFRLLLEEHPEWHKRVSMLALLDPSRQPSRVRRVPRDESNKSRAVNAQFGGDWLAADRLRVADDFAQSVAATSSSTSCRDAVYDGMNLVAKGGAARERSAGVLVLSENAGAHEELRDWR